MLKLYGVVHNQEQSPLLTKYDEQISVLSLYQSVEAAAEAFKKVCGQWKDAADYKVIEWDMKHLKGLHETEERLGIRVVVHID